MTIGGPRHIKEFQFDEKLLPMVPSTDAGVLFDISSKTSDLHPPITLMEYDPAISTLWSTLSLEKKEFELKDMRGIQEREFLRSLVQISETSSGRKSYVYTIDRLIYPQKDINYKSLSIRLNNREYKFPYYDSSSQVLKVIICLLKSISSDRHESVFGYPDPLYEADQYVKTLGRTHLETLDIALTEIDLDEFETSYRETRATGGG